MCVSVSERERKRERERERNDEYDGESHCNQALLGTNYIIPINSFARTIQLYLSQAREGYANVQYKHIYNREMDYTTFLDYTQR